MQKIGYYNYSDEEIKNLKPFVYALMIENNGIVPTFEVSQIARKQDDAYRIAVKIAETLYERGIDISAFNQDLFLQHPEFTALNIERVNKEVEKNKDKIDQIIIKENGYNIYCHEKNACVDDIKDKINNRLHIDYIHKWIEQAGKEATLAFEHINEILQYFKTNGIEQEVKYENGFCYRIDDRAEYFDHEHRRHRTDGPAIEVGDDFQAYYFKGMETNKPDAA